MQQENTKIITQTLPTENNTPPRRRLTSAIKYLGTFTVALGSAMYGYLQLPQFASPKVEPQPYQARFYDGKFHNLVDAPVMSGNDSFFVGLYKFLTDKQDNDVKPSSAIPSVKTDLHNLSLTDNTIVWMGHSSYYLQLDGVRFLVDPVFSENASPVPYTNVAFQGSNIYTADDIPEIDYLLITHDHWDHLDYPTLNVLQHKIKQVITPVGVGSYLTKWGFSEESIFEGDWYSAFKEKDLEIHVLPAQHFSGRLLTRNQTLWGSFALITPNHKIYLGGDSGYGEHFKDISSRLGAFDVAILEAGQYNENWAFIHMMPEETVQAAVDLQAKAFIPSHNSKFKLSKHAWYEPLERVAEVSKDKNYQLMTPMIGETVRLDDPQQEFSAWWK
ncbi:MBL fold metallo-hydrolase [Vibrio sp. HA2012]|uniref:MBL fold metallo-hydrolase n=1 Tax=Vibrio sp. HA2012 TaxID=1971595 RepID=UPI0018E26D3A|nr:MBL fold metallo-hydrolase [Vibrio sp. HA2012]